MKKKKTKEALVVLSNGLRMPVTPLVKPVPFKWNKKITRAMIKEAIEEGRNLHNEVLPHSL